MKTFVTENEAYPMSPAKNPSAATRRTNRRSLRRWLALLGFGGAMSLLGATNAWGQAPAATSKYDAEAPEATQSPLVWQSDDRKWSLDEAEVKKPVTGGIDDEVPTRVAKKQTPAEDFGPTPVESPVRGAPIVDSLNMESPITGAPYSGGANLNQGAIASAFADTDETCEEPVVHPHIYDQYTPSLIVYADTLYFNRVGDAGASLTTFPRMRRYDYELGGRVGVRKFFDDVAGMEFIYTGPFHWTADRTLTAAGGLTSRLSSPVFNLAAFNTNGTFQRQFNRSRLQSFEANQIWYAYNVMTLSAGARYIAINEVQNLTARNVANDFGYYNVNADNNLYGGQMGAEFYYPVGNWSSLVKIKGGIFANSASTQTQLQLNNTRAIDNARDKTVFASIVETGSYTTWQMTPHLKVRGGYEFWWIYGLANAVANSGGALTAASGSTMNYERSNYYHGLALGAELSY